MIIVASLLAHKPMSRNMPKKSPAKSKKIAPVSKTAPKKPDTLAFARLWLWLGWAALAIGGLYAVILVGARSPKVQDLFPFADVFQTSLIVHVDLTVLVWLLSATAMWWSLYANNAWPVLRLGAFSLSATGAVLIAASPFTGDPHPLLNNYVPVLMQPVFLLGLLLFLCGIVLQTMIVLTDMKNDSITAVGLKFTAIVVATSLMCLVMSARQLKTADLLPTDYYEHLFWASGHTLQIAYTLVCVVGWLALAAAIGIKIKAGEAWVKVALAFSALLGLSSLYAYSQWPVISAEHLNFFTLQMKHGGGITAIVIGALLLHGLFTGKFPKASPIRNTLFASFILFMAGGLIAFMISGANVTVPAHYHGSIVGVSLALMGVAYAIMPQLGYRKIEGKVALIQPWLYGGGQLLHITGLAWSGGYGTLRKTPGAAQTIEGQTAMGLMGLGGALSILGGLIFVVIIWRAARQKA